jgi:UDP-glucose 4-epimerase
MGKRALVTGAAGFIGSHVADHCLAMGMDVVATDDLSVGVADNVPAGAAWREGDVADADFVRSLFEGGRFDYVYHLAAYATQHLSHYARRHNYLVNVVGSMHLINEAIRRGCECFVFASSSAVYGREQVPMREDVAPRPDDPYGIAKYTVEMDLRLAHEKFGLNYVVHRPHNVYGERQNLAPRDKNVVAVFINQSLLGRPMTIWGDGSQVRPFSHVDDVAPLIARSPLVPAAANEAFNVGADATHTIRELAEAVAAACGVPPEVVRLPARHEIPRVVADHSKLQRVFRPPPGVTLEEGLRRTVAWARRRGPVREPAPEHVELPERLESDRRHQAGEAVAT